MTEIIAPIDFIRRQANVSEISVPAGTIISKPGDQCQNLIILLQGQVRVYRPAEDGRSITLYHIGESESCILTASCILNTSTFPAIAEVEKDAKGIIIPAEKVQQWLKTEHVWQQYIFSLLSQRMAALISLVDALAFRNLDVRLAQWLLEQSQLQMVINTTHQIIAEELASSREVISRLLKEFEHDGLVTLKRGQVEITNKKELKKLSHM